MADFKKSMLKGIEAAEHAAKNVKEIDEVFDDLKNQLLEATDNKVEIFREPAFFTEPDPNAKNAGTASFLGNRRIRKAVQIACKNPKLKGVGESLAEFKLAKSGYPCEIKLHSEELMCKNREGLEAALERLLSDPVVGEKIYKVMNLDL